MTLPDLNRAQTVVLLVGAGIALLLLLFPPWRISDDRGPQHRFLLQQIAGRLAVQILILELAAIGVAIGVLLWALNTRTRQFF